MWHAGSAISNEKKLNISGAKLEKDEVRNFEVININNGSCRNWAHEGEECKSENAETKEIHAGNKAQIFLHLGEED